MKEHDETFLAVAAALALAALPALATEATFERNLLRQRTRGPVRFHRLGQRSPDPRRGQPGAHLRPRQIRLGRPNDEQRAADRGAIRPSSRRATSSASARVTRTCTTSASTMKFRLRQMLSSTPVPAPETLPTTASAANAKLSTGSGNIHATGLHGGFTVDTGSGNIYAEQTGQGDVKAQTGSGNIELRNLQRRPPRRYRIRRNQGGRIASLRMEARNRLGQHRVLARQHRLHARRVHRLGQHPHRPRDADARLAEPSPRHRQNRTAAAPQYASRPAQATSAFTNRDQRFVTAESAPSQKMIPSARP